MKESVRLCPCCMESHATKVICVKEKNIFKGELIEYKAEYCYCEITDETYADEDQITANDIAMKNAYRKKMGLLSSEQIKDIRTKYSISQSDLCLLLGWGAKTITRYESHQVQDKAHDSILRKLYTDPEWFLELVDYSKDSLSPAAYSKYMEIGTTLFENDHDSFLKYAILSKYARYIHNNDANGNKELSLDTVVDMIHFYANSPLVKNLYLVKLLKMLWYADALSYKRYGQAISGLVYRSLKMGAVPIAYETIIDLSTIPSEEIDMGNGIGQKILPASTNKYPNLTRKDITVLEYISECFGSSSTKEIVETMHKEDAYLNTPPQTIIMFEHAKTLSLN